MPKATSHACCTSVHLCRVTPFHSPIAFVTMTKSGKKKIKDKPGGVAMESVAGGGSLTAQRFAGKPLLHPGYSFRDVPKCSRNLAGSAVCEVTNRDDFNDSLAEMVKLCSETMRRQADAKTEEAAREGNAAPVKRTTKPLSLEYMADRMDVDDPIWGFFVRTAAKSVANGKQERGCAARASPTPPSAPTAPSKEGGELQGFATVTSFTNWQKSFRWDSMHDVAFAYDDVKLAEAMRDGTRKCDRDGTLAEAMQSTLRCGDPWNEGIVWPNIAEISLLGGLGCGRALVELVIERLERLPPSAKRNYQYVVLQATENSVSFYESLGFVRVGCITDNKNYKEEGKGEERDSGSTTETDSDSSDPNVSSATNGSTTNPESMSSKQGSTCEPKHADAKSPASSVPPLSEIVSSAVNTYTTKKENEKISDIGKRLGHDTWDIIFLNHFLYPGMVSSSKMKKDSEIFVPSKKTQIDACSHALRNRTLHEGKSDAQQWYFTEDDETPKDIAAKFNVDCKDLVKGNRDRLSDLMPFAHLMEDTRIKVSHFDQHTDRRVPYCHWTFPDDTLETSEPSYMMAMKLDRKKGAAAKHRPVELSLPPVVPYERAVHAPQLASGSGFASGTTALETPKKELSTKKRKRARMEKHPDEPEKPKRPMTSYFFFMNEVRDQIKAELGTNDVKILAGVIGQRWKELSDRSRSRYQLMNERAKADYGEAMKSYEANMDRFRLANPDWAAEQKRRAAAAEEAAASAAVRGRAPRNLFNKVVRLNEEGRREAGTEFEYYYVLTYLPDLQWCHLAPMRKKGKWGSEKPKAMGRPKWMLVSENLGKEVDISASVCEVVKARGLKNNPDADKEQWDIPESATPVPGSTGKGGPAHAQASTNGGSAAATSPKQLPSDAGTPGDRAGRTAPIRQGTSRALAPAPAASTTTTAKNRVESTTTSSPSPKASKRSEATRARKNGRVAVNGGGGGSARKSRPARSPGRRAKPAERSSPRLRKRPRT